jgi:hypothetical protein
MVIKSNTVQAGWHIDNDDSSIDNHSTGSTFGINRNKNQSKNDQEPFTGFFFNKSTHNMLHNDEERQNKSIERFAQRRVQILVIIKQQIETYHSILQISLQIMRFALNPFDTATQPKQ